MSSQQDANGYYALKERIRGERVQGPPSGRFFTKGRRETKRPRGRSGRSTDRRLRVKHLIEDVLADSLERNSARHVQDQRYVLGLFAERFGERRLEELRPAECNQYALSLRTKAVAGTEGKTAVMAPRSTERVNAHLRILKAAFNFGLRMRYLDYSPFEPVERLASDARPPRVLSVEEYQKVLSRIRSYDEDMAELVEVLAITGMRRSEALTLMSWDSIRWEKGHIELVGTKGRHKDRRKYRYLPLTPRVRAILERRARLGEPFVWMKQDHNCSEKKRRVRILPDHLSHMFAKLSRAAGVMDTTVHDLRRTYATMLAERGLQENLLIKATGHAAGAVTDQFYIGPALGAIGRAMAEVEAALSAPASASETVTSGGS